MFGKLFHKANEKINLYPLGERDEDKDELEFDIDKLDIQVAK